MFESYLVVAGIVGMALYTLWACYQAWRSWRSLKGLDPLKPYYCIERPAIYMPKPNRTKPAKTTSSHQSMAYFDLNQPAEGNRK